MQTTFKILIFAICAALCAPLFVCAKESRAIVGAVEEARQSGVTEGDLNRMMTAGYRYSVNEKDLAAWINTVSAAARKGLPHRPLIDKLEEGLAKRIRTRQISAVINRQMEQLQEADRLMQQAKLGRSSRNESSVIRVADLLATGLTHSEAEHLLSTHSRIGMGERLEALTFFIVMKQAGLSPEYAERVVISGFNNNYFAEFPMDMAFMVKAAKSRKISDERIFSEVMSVVQGKKSSQDAKRSLGLDISRQPTPYVDKGHPSADRGKGHAHGNSEARDGGQGSGNGSGSGGAGDAGGSGGGDGGSGGGGGGGR